MKSIKFLFVLLLGWTFENVYSRVPSERIVGGAAAYAGQYPFSAAMYIQTNISSYFCGGALIDRQWILTAAHCVDGALESRILLGSNHLSGNDPNRETLTSSHFVSHSKYNPLTLENDIALVQLRLPVELTDYIKPIQLTETDIPTYAPLTAIGWGQISDNDPALANALQYVDLITITNEECANTYGYQVSKEMVCAAGNYLEGTCLGDTGSPLIQHIYNPQGVRHAGISSFISGDGCEKPHPSGYTRTYYFLDWIANVTKSNQL